MIRTDVRSLLKRRERGKSILAKSPVFKRVYEEGFKTGLDTATLGGTPPRIIIVAPTQAMGYTVARWFDLNPKCVVPAEPLYLQSFGRATTVLLYIGAGYAAFRDYAELHHTLEMNQSTIIYVPEFKPVHRSIESHWDSKARREREGNV